MGNFEAARRLLEALGYRLTVMYEKYRTTYHLRHLIVVLDEMPYGNFVEIEGSSARAIHAAANQIGLRWEARSEMSYLALFEHLRAVRGLPATRTCPSRRWKGWRSPQLTLAWNSQIIDDI